ncbi:MAG: hypothetical protein MI975_03995 [Cytophagales bacterium]|nr:hypothetical protein [Cytophagales bacterium]
MISLASLLLLLSVWCLYIAAERLELEVKGPAARLTEHPKLTRILSVLFCIGGTVLLIRVFGLATGALASLSIWTRIAGLIVLFAPFNKIKIIPVAVILVAVIIVELIFR